jgi:hypothetical protein
MKKKHGEKIDIVRCVRVEGENTAGKLERAMHEVLNMAENVTKIMVKFFRFIHVVLCLSFLLFVSADDV